MLTPVNSNLSKGEAREIKCIGGDLRGGHTLTQIDCDKTPLPSPVHMLTYRTASSLLSQGGIHLNETHTCRHTPQYVFILGEHFLNNLEVFCLKTTLNEQRQYILVLTVFNCVFR